jgi:hypothetical protein
MGDTHFFDLDREWETFVQHLMRPSSCYPPARKTLDAASLARQYLNRPAASRGRSARALLRWAATGATLREPAQRLRCRCGCSPGAVPYELSVSARFDSGQRVGSNSVRGQARQFGAPFRQRSAAGSAQLQRWPRRCRARRALRRRAGVHLECGSAPAPLYFFRWYL